MKKIVLAVLAFVLLLSINKSNAQRFEQHLICKYNRCKERKYFQEPSRDFNRNYCQHDFRIGFDRGRIYYNQPRFVYHHVPIVRFANYYQSRRLGYYYYPSVNVYFSPFTHLYIYQYSGAWVSGEVLPHGIYINEPYTQVYCNVGENIWMYNRSHIESFKRTEIVPERQFGRPNVARPIFERHVGNGPRGHR